MKKISRSNFLKTTSLALAATFTPKKIFGENNNDGAIIDESMIARLVKANDKSVEKILKEPNEPQKYQNYRKLSSSFSFLAAAYCHQKSFYFKSKEVLNGLDQKIEKLFSFQYPNGTLDAGGNRQSPPDTAFVLEHLCASAEIFDKNNFQEIVQINKKLKQFLINAGEGIRTGGVHTPNHRWEISSILAQMYSLFKDQKYIERIDEWLAEGIYINEDGNYPERSRGYSIVESNAFIHIAEKLNRPKLYDIVKKNLVANYYYMEANGELVSLDSRRQDQYNNISIAYVYLIYRYMAIKENDEFLAAVTREIETLDEFNNIVLDNAFPLIMASSILSSELPKSQKLPINYSKYFVQSDLVRIKRGDNTASIFAGNDQPFIIASGRSCIPTFFTFRKRFAILEYARLSTSFFNTGYVRGDGLKKEGNKYILTEKKEAYYYHPLPKDKLNERGDYNLTESLDGRYWSKLDFDLRLKTTLTLESKITIEEIDNTFKIDIDVNGAENVEVTLDLCFRKGGAIEGGIPGAEEDEFFLENGFAKYTFGNDSIEVGPGKLEHTNLGQLDGELYSTHFGSIRGKGEHLFITGLIPFKHSITIK